MRLNINANQPHKDIRQTRKSYKVRFGMPVRFQSKGNTQMNIYLKSASIAAVVGLGMLASSGTAFAFGCITPGQAQYSLLDHTDTANDAERAADVKTFRCPVNTVGTAMSQYMPVQKPAVNARSTTPASSAASAAASVY